MKSATKIVMSPDGKTTFSTLIKDAMGSENPAPIIVTCKDGTVLRNKWVVESHRSTPLMGERSPHYVYLPFGSDEGDGKTPSFREGMKSSLIFMY